MMRTLLLRAIQAALHAGQRIMKIYNTDFRVWQKHDKSPLTAADCYGHDIIQKLLGPTELPILSEEGKKIPFATRSSWDLFWMVDPLDGTKEFIKKNGEFTVNIALISGQEPVLGVVYVPYMNLLYFSNEKKFAYKLVWNIHMADFLYSDLFDVFTSEMNVILSTSQRLPLPQPQNRPYTIVGSRSHNTAELDDYLLDRQASMGNVKFVAVGSSLKICLVAEGSADEYPRTGPTMEWDTAAGHAIAKGAGAEIIESVSGLPLIYNKRSMKNPDFHVSRWSKCPQQKSLGT